MNADYTRAARRIAPPPTAVNHLFRRRHPLLAGGALALPLAARAQSGGDWSRIEAAARGQTVSFNAGAGRERTNADPQWAAGELARRWGVKLSDTAEVVKLVTHDAADVPAGAQTLLLADA